MISPSPFILILSLFRINSDSIDLLFSVLYISSLDILDNVYQLYYLRPLCLQAIPSSGCSAYGVHVQMFGLQRFGPAELGLAEWQTRFSQKRH